MPEINTGVIDTRHSRPVSESNLRHGMVPLAGIAAVGLLTAACGTSPAVPTSVPVQPTINLHSMESQQKFLADIVVKKRPVQVLAHCIARLGRYLPVLEAPGGKITATILEMDQDPQAKMFPYPHYKTDRDQALIYGDVLVRNPLFFVHPYDQTQYVMYNIPEMSDTSAASLAFTPFKMIPAQSLIRTQPNGCSDLKPATFLRYDNNRKMIMAIDGQEIVAGGADLARTQQ